MEAIVESEVMPSESPNVSHKLHDHFLTKKERSTGSPKSPCSDPSTVEQTPKTNCSCQSTVEKVSVQSNNETDTLKRERSSVLCLGAIHTPKPIDTIDIKTIYMTTDQDKFEAKCLVKSVCVEKNASDISIQMPDSDTIFAHSLDKGLEKVQNELSKSSSSSSPQSTERALISQESEEKECVWDTSVSSGCNVILHNQIENGMSTCESAQRKDRSVKGSIIKDALESAKTSMSRASDSSGVSDDSNWSNANGSVNKPHKGNDPRWKAIIDARTRDGMLGMKHFRLLKQLGCGDIGTVYLAELGGTQSNFAMKVMDKVSLANRKKLTRAQTEREILQLLDHPFLPTLYTHFETERFSCLVMEFCSGGDLHTLRQRQPGKHFSEYAARFYAAEILLALEYLHMLGVVYRDLKPENVLVRSDGHIMLSDFDLSLRCTVSPTLIKSSSFSSDPSKRTSGTFCVQPACIEPASVCIQPVCFLPRFFPKKNKKKSANLKTESRPRLNTLPELVVEPTSARSMSFVGTHEYLAPEIIKGEGHGSAVDWWTFGIFLHELLYGRTPFKGAGNRATLFNVIGQQLKFPDSPVTSYSSRDLIRGLLVKEPQHRLGYKRGATEIKNHPFFEGVNWALIRCSTPPDIPKVESELVTKIGPALDTGNKKMVGADVKSGGKYLDFEFF